MFSFSFFNLSIFFISFIYNIAYKIQELFNLHIIYLMPIKSGNFTYLIYSDNSASFLSKRINRLVCIKLFRSFLLSSLSLVFLSLFFISLSEECRVLSVDTCNKFTKKNIMSENISIVRWVFKNSASSIGS